MEKISFFSMLTMLIYDVKTQIINKNIDILFNIGKMIGLEINMEQTK
jgi:hypothetical protein